MSRPEAEGATRAGTVDGAMEVACADPSDRDALFDLHMMAVVGGRERTEAEYDHLFAAAGLQRTATLPTPGLRAVIEARTR